MMHDRGLFMNRHKFRILRDRSGSIALEATLVLPPLLILVIFFLALIQHQQQLIVLSEALDQTAAELSLLLPVQQAGSDAIGEWMETHGDLPKGNLSKGNLPIGNLPLGNQMSNQMEGEIGPWLAQAGEEATEWADNLVLEVLIDRRLSVWLGRASVKSSKPNQKKDHQSHLQEIFKNRNITASRDTERHSLSITCVWNCRILGLPVRSEIRTAVPVWEVHVADSQESAVDQDEIWQLDNFSRGQILRQYFQANLPYDFPVIARWSNGEATVIHSVDLTAPTYASSSEIRSVVHEKLAKLVNFMGYMYQKDGEMIHIKQDDIRTRRMILVVPANYDHERIWPVLTELQSEASDNGMKLVIETYGESGRYTRE